MRCGEQLFWGEPFQCHIVTFVNAIPLPLRDEILHLFNGVGMKSNKRFERCLLE